MARRLLPFALSALLLAVLSSVHGEDPDIQVSTSCANLDGIEGEGAGEGETEWVACTANEVYRVVFDKGEIAIATSAVQNLTADWVNYADEWGMLKLPAEGDCGAEAESGEQDCYQGILPRRRKLASDNVDASAHFCCKKSFDLWSQVVEDKIEACRMKSSCKTLDLWGLGIRELPFTLFTGLKRVTKLILSDNRLTIVDRSFRELFKYLPNLEELYLDDNLIRRTDGSWQWPTKFRVLSMRHNQMGQEGLQALHNGFLSTIGTLQVLDLSYNLFSSFSSTQWDGLNSLTVLRLQGNSLKTVPSQMFTGLTNLLLLHLSNNMMSVLEYRAFKGLKNLQMLYLSHNNLARVPESAFADTQDIIELHLHNNRLVALPRESLLGVYVDLSGNPQLPVDDDALALYGICTPATDESSRVMLELWVDADGKRTSKDISKLVQKPCPDPPTRREL